ncbi:hypothetical protein GC175_26705 [bacterium]|nr:hypothetical protein [bacterium]
MVRLPKREEYVQGFLEIYDEAVRCRLRSHRPVGTTLSGGLDSGSVTALAAKELARQGKRLTAFTAVPVYDTADTVGPKRFGDETHFAAATAAHCPIVDHHFFDSAQVTPILGIQRTLAVMPEPSHAAGNYFWMVDLLSRAREMGLGTLLTGQGGNATVSWTGAPALRSPAAAFRYGGWKEGLRGSLPHWLLRPILAARRSGQDWRGTAIHADFAQRIHLSQLRNAAIGQDINLQESWRSPQDCRHAIILPGASHVGAIWARFGASAGLEVRDPTQDKRVMAYTLSIPDEVTAPMAEVVGSCGLQWQDCCRMKYGSIRCVVVSRRIWRNVYSPAATKWKAHWRGGSRPRQSLFGCGQDASKLARCTDHRLTDDYPPCRLDPVTWVTCRIFFESKLCLKVR